jgi:hypothetical protein
MTEAARLRHSRRFLAGLVARDLHRCTFKLRFEFSAALATFRTKKQQ